MTNEVSDHESEFFRRAAIKLRAIGRAHIATHLETLQRIADAIAAELTKREAELAALRAENERLLESAKAEARKAGMMRAAEIIGLMRDSANEIVVEDPTPSNRREAAGLVKCLTVVIEAIRAEAKGSGG